MALSGIGSNTRRHIHVRGIVQGVGFRPFVYKLAQSLGLTGYVFNSSSGVTIEIEGDKVEIEQFVSALRNSPPHLSEITEIVCSVVEARGDTEFNILHSRDEPGEFSLVSPDAGTCDACWRDFGDPNNRRYGYPFTNCTHCGPRYSIIEGVPYDRCATTMASFHMCRSCLREYENPEDRRFHAQPNACADCGPSLMLSASGSSATPSSFIDLDSLAILRQARRLLHGGKILAVKGLGGFLLACDAQNDAAVRELRRRKRRPHKPFALMARDLASVRALCEVSPENEISLLHMRRPIVVLPQVDGTELSCEIAPGNHTLGVMLPYTPLHYLLFSDSPEMTSEFPALVMTSGNLSEEAIIISNVEAMSQLGGIADWFLLHNRDIATRVDDSVVRCFEGKERLLRRSRGFVPLSIDLGIQMEEVLAFGGELKNTFCLTKARYAILSQHIGDLDNYETMRFFEETLGKMKRLFKLQPRIAAHDLHPDYRSTRMALASGIERLIGVQHHHAHIASCMAENRIEGKVIGVAMDGTGYGTDGAIWGGEFLLADLASFERCAHLRYVSLPGGDAAVRQPWRMAFSYLRDSFGQQLPSDLAFLRGIPAKSVELVDTMLSRRFQTAETSSCGRLFDAVAALVGLAPEVTFEGQAAIALESAAAPGVSDRYAFDVSDGEPMIVDFRPTILAIVRDLSLKRRVGEISACFHNTLSVAIVEVCCRIRSSASVDRVCLSGGTFQNLLLLERTVVELRRQSFGVFLHATVPANDGGISLGQAVIANERFRRGV